MEPLHGNLACITIVSIRTNTTKLRNTGIVSPAIRSNHLRFQKQTSTFDAQGDHTFPRKLPHVPYFVPQKLIASKFISTRRPDQFIRLHMSLCKPSSNSVSRHGPIKLLKSRLNKQRNWLYGWLN